MNNTQNSQSRPSGRFGGLRGLGRGIALSSMVAVMGVGTLSAADASAAGVAQGVRYSASSTTQVVKPAPTDLPTASSRQLVVRDGAVRER